MIKSIITKSLKDSTDKSSADGLNSNSSSSIQTKIFQKIKRIGIYGVKRALVSKQKSVMEKILKIKK